MLLYLAGVCYKITNSVRLILDVSEGFLMIISTTPTIEGRQIIEYLDIVSTCHVMAIPGGNKMIKRGWLQAVNNVKEDLASQAKEQGANAIVGLRLEAYKSGMADYLYATGTAVKC